MNYHWPEHTPTVRSADRRPAAASRRTLAFNIETALVGYRRHQTKVQLALLLVFFVLLLAPLAFSHAVFADGPFGTVSAFAALLLWGVWLPLLLVSAAFAGRLWCGLLCPMGAATEWLSRIGRQRPIPGWLKWTGLPLASFLAVSLLNEALGADEDPLALALLFGSLFALALAVGFLYGRDKRAWCRHACPIGLMLGIASRLGMVSFDPKLKRRGGEFYTEKTLCPTMIDVKSKEESRHCLACGKCLAPGARGGLAIAFRPLGSEIAGVAHRNPDPVEVLFVFAAIGLALVLELPNLAGVAEWLSGMGYDQGFLPTLIWLTAATALAITGLGALTLAAAHALARLSSVGSPRRWFFRIGYSLAPIALALLLFSMCGIAFEGLAALGLAATTIAGLKALILVAALVHSVRIVGGALGQRRCGT